jgi:L-asparaginase
MYVATNKTKDDKAVNKIYIMNTLGEKPKGVTKVKSNGDIEPYKNDPVYDHDTYLFDPPINSSDIVPNDWNSIVKNIDKVYDDYDSFVVVCGGDTLPYTASALSFMMENLSKPIVVTDNELAKSVDIAKHVKIPEVMVVSGGKLLRGCRTARTSTDHFSSPNYPVLVDSNSLPIPEEPLQVKLINPKTKVIVVKLFPGIDEKYMTNILQGTEVHGIVFEVYDTGNSPTSPKFLSTIQKMVQNGIVVVAVSQCTEVTQTDIDQRLVKAGVLPGYDMTTAAAYTKLCFLLSNVTDRAVVAQLMNQSFRGEITQPS